ncbi:hypothetical protein RAD15_26400 [Bradyrhizobium sp. 14AA]
MIHAGFDALVLEGSGLGRSVEIETYKHGEGQAYAHCGAPHQISPSVMRLLVIVSRRAIGKDRLQTASEERGGFFDAILDPYAIARIVAAVGKP